MTSEAPTLLYRPLVLASSVYFSEELGREIIDLLQQFRGSACGTTVVRRQNPNKFSHLWIN